MVTALVRRAPGCAVVISIDRRRLLGAHANCGTAGSGAARGLRSERGRSRHAHGPARIGLTAWTICGDRGAYGGWLSARPGAPAARAFGGCVGGVVARAGTRRPAARGYRRARSRIRSARAHRRRLPGSQSRRRAARQRRAAGRRLGPNGCHRSRCCCRGRSRSRRWATSSYPRSWT